MNKKIAILLLVLGGFLLLFLDMRVVGELKRPSPDVATSTHAVAVATSSEAFKPPRTATSSIKVIPIVPRTKVATTTKLDAKAVELSTNPEAAKLIQLVNAERAANGLKPLKENGKLDRGAQWKAEDMDAKQYWAHYSPSGEGVGAWLRKTGYEYHNAGENLAMGFSTNEGVIAGWMNSPTHKANILDPNYTETGIGIKIGTFGGASTTFITQFFGEPYE